MDKVITKEEAAKDLQKLAEDKRAAAKKEAEARGAATVSPTETQKTKEELAKDKEAQDAKVKAEAQAKEDERVLSAKDEDLSAEDKTRKTVILKEKEDKEKAIAEKEAKDNQAILDAKEEDLNEEQRERRGKLVTEDAEKKKQAKLDARFGELTGKIKDLERDAVANKDEITTLKTERDELASKDKPAETEELVIKTFKENLSKYAKEDKEKPREQRREMTKEELDDWLIEDLGEANDWMAERSYRRAEDKRTIRQGLATEGLDKKQRESLDRVFKKHPEMDTEKSRERIIALKKEKKSVQEIADVLAEEFPEVVLTYQVGDEHPEWGKEADGPERVMREVEKRMANPKKPIEGEDTEADKLRKENDDLRQKNEDLQTEIDKADNTDIGINSNTKGPVRKPGDKAMTDPETLLCDTMRSKGASEKSIASALKSFRDKHKK